MARETTVLLASDGSAPARAAAALTVRFPWPDRTRVVGLVADAPPVVIGAGAFFRGLLAQSYESEASRLERFLERHVRTTRVVLVHRPPVDAILDQQQRDRADIIVVGDRGLGAVGRFPLGSVSRRIVRLAPCPVLVAKGRPRRAHRFLIAIDGSAASTRAVELVSRLKPSPAHHALVVSVVPQVPVPSMGRAPESVRTEVARSVAAAEKHQLVTARRWVDSAARRLRRSGWRVTTEVRRGAPLRVLMDTSTAWKADVVVCGQRKTRGLNRLLLGSVADGLLSASRVSVLIART